MNASLDLKQLEQKTFAAIFQDGLLDIVIGLFIFGVGIADTFAYSNYILYAIFLICPLLWFLGKKLITQPRLGQVSFSVKRKKILGQSLWLFASLITVSIVLGFLGLWALKSSPKMAYLLQLNFGLFVGLHFAIFLIIASLIFYLKRLHFYALLVFWGFFTDYLFDYTITYCVILAGFIITVSGLYFLLKFLDNYSLNNANKIYEEERRK